MAKLRQTVRKTSVKRATRSRKASGRTRKVRRVR